MKLPDGSRIPSNLSVGPRSDVREMAKNNMALRSGTISKIVYPDDKESVTKREIEYHVEVVQNLGVNGTNTVRYRNCRCNNIFGTANNSLVYTLQQDDSGSPTLDEGALVLLLCIDGSPDNSQAIIIGGLSNLVSKNKKYKKADGQFYDFNFNGINFNINKDGEWTLEFNSPVSPKGKKANEPAAGTKIKIDKEGRLKISDNENQSWELDRVAKKSTWTNGNESVVIDKENKKVELTSTGEMSQHSAKQMSASTDDKMSLSSKADMSSKSEANMSMEASSNMKMKSGGAWQVDVSGSALIKAGDSVQIEGGNLASLKGLINKIGAGSVPAAGVSISQTFGITGAPGTPMTTLVITGSGTVFIGS